MIKHYFTLLRNTWKYAGQRKSYFVITYLFFIIANVITMLEPIVFAWFINVIQEGGVTAIQDALWYLIIYTAMNPIFWIFHGSGRIFERITSFEIVSNYRNHLFSTLSSLPLKWHKNHHSGEIMSRVEKSLKAMEGFSDWGYRYIETIIRFVGAFAAICFLLPVAGLATFLLGLLIIFTITKFDKILIQYLKTMNEKWHKANSIFYDYITNIITVITLRLEQLAQNEVAKKVLGIRQLNTKNIILNEVKWFSVSMGLTLLNFAILALYVWEKVTIEQGILVGSIVALYQYTDRLKFAFFNFAWQYENLVWQNTNRQSADIIFQAGQEYAQSSPKDKASAHWKNIQITKLSFNYEDEARKLHTLKNINLSLTRGQKIALVGESGSGKSTIMTLIRGLEEANTVKIAIDSKEYSSLRALSELVTLIPQEPEIFENTIEYNITIGLHHSKKELEEVCKMARFDEVVKRLPNGFQTNIKEKGVNLSGGEKQRLALARGLFAAKNSSIILMDEPTSSVDPENETKIYNTIFHEFKEQCIISSIHRLHLLPKFDYLYLFENGEIIGHGTFRNLLESNQRFQEIWNIYQQTLKPIGENSKI